MNIFNLVINWLNLKNNLIDFKSQLKTNHLSIKFLCQHAFQWRQALTHCASHFNYFSFLVQWLLFLLLNKWFFALHSRKLSLWLRLLLFLQSFMKFLNISEINTLFKIILDFFFYFLEAFWLWSPLTIFLKIYCFSFNDFSFFFKLTILAKCLATSLLLSYLLGLLLDCRVDGALDLVIFLFFLGTLLVF